MDYIWFIAAFVNVLFVVLECVGINPKRKITSDNIYKVLVDFGKVYEVMDQLERRKLMESLIEEIQIHEEKTAEGQWLKAIRFRLQINPEGDSDGLDDVKPP